MENRKKTIKGGLRHSLFVWCRPLSNIRSSLTLCLVHCSHAGNRSCLIPLVVLKSRWLFKKIRHLLSFFVRKKTSSFFLFILTIYSNLSPKLLLNWSRYIITGRYHRDTVVYLLDIVLDEGFRRSFIMTFICCFNKKFFKWM